MYLMYFFFKKKTLLLFDFVWSGLGFSFFFFDSKATKKDSIKQLKRAQSKKLNHDIKYNKMYYNLLIIKLFVSKIFRIHSLF
jgi:hypothetical protein